MKPCGFCSSVRRLPKRRPMRRKHNTDPSLEGNKSMSEDDPRPDHGPGEGSLTRSADPVNRSEYLRCAEDREAFLKRLKARSDASDEAFARLKRGWPK
jgi:hypothetical protein